VLIIAGSTVAWLGLATLGVVYWALLKATIFVFVGAFAV
jgi:hypothetical protein